MRKAICFFIVIALLFFLCSCGKSAAVPFYGRSVFLTKGGYIVDIDNHYYIYADINEQPVDFIIDPLATEKSMANVLCSDGVKVYYENEKSEIICRDMVTYEEKLYFRPSDNLGISLLGLTDAVTNTVEDGNGFYDMTAMYIDSLGNAYAVCNNQLCQLKNGKVIPVLENYIYSICYDGNRVYFVDIARDFYVCNSDGNDLHKIVETKVSSVFCISDDKIWFQPLNDLNSIYSCSLYGTDTQIFATSEDGINTFRVDEKYIYYTDAKNRYLYRSSIDSFAPEMLLKQMVVNFNPIYGTDRIFASVSEGNSIVETIID